MVDPRDRDQQVFTEAGAWEFIAELLEQGCVIEVIELDKPKGKTGYVIKTPGGLGKPLIYIKVQLGSGTIIGRSFHYDK